MASYKFLYKIWFEIHNQSVPQTSLGSYFQKGKVFLLRKEFIFPSEKNHPLLEDVKFKLLLYMSLMLRVSRNVSFSDNNHILKFFTKVFENLPSLVVIKLFFNIKNLLSNFELCTRLHWYFSYGKFHLDIHNKMAGNNGTALPHERVFDISKDRFSWIDIFIRWFEDYQLPTGRP